MERRVAKDGMMSMAQSVRTNTNSSPKRVAFSQNDQVKSKNYKS